jgi:hypothetical protein
MLVAFHCIPGENLAMEAKYKQVEMIRIKYNFLSLLKLLLALITVLKVANELFAHLRKLLVKKLTVI